jgi:hypothetical protein
LSIYTTYKPAGGSDGLYLKLQDGDSAKVRIASEPAIFTQEFNNEGEITLSTKFAWVVWNRADKKAQVFNGGKSIYNQIADLVEEWGEPTTFDITVKRTGQMLETRYSVNPAPKSQDLTDEEQAACDKIDLLKATKGHWLKDFKDGATPSPNPTNQEDEIGKFSESDIPAGW